VHICSIDTTSYLKVKGFFARQESWCCIVLLDDGNVVCIVVDMKDEVTKRMATEFQGDVTPESILQALDEGVELAGDEQALAAPGIAVFSFVV